MRRPALALAAAALLLAGCGSESPEAGACSAAGMASTLPEQALPSPAAETRQRIVDAAVACDYAALAELAREGTDAFTFSFGGGPSPVAYWQRLEASGERPLASLVAVLGLSPAQLDGRIHAWPAAHGARATDEDWQAVVDAGVVSAADADEMRSQGNGYLGWRAGIAADGEWLFFVAGD